MPHGHGKSMIRTAAGSYLSLKISLYCLLVIHWRCSEHFSSVTPASDVWCVYNKERSQQDYPIRAHTILESQEKQQCYTHHCALCQFKFTTTRYTFKLETSNYYYSHNETLSFIIQQRVFIRVIGFYSGIHLSHSFNSIST